MDDGKKRGSAYDIERAQLAYGSQFKNQLTEGKRIIRIESNFLEAGSRHVRGNIQVMILGRTRVPGGVTLKGVYFGVPTYILSYTVTQPRD